MAAPRKHRDIPLHHHTAKSGKRTATVHPRSGKVDNDESLVRVLVNLPSRLLATIDHYALNHGMSRSAVMREGMGDWYKGKYRKAH